MILEDGLSENMHNKIKLASQQANSLSQKFGFQSNISVICKSDQQGTKVVQYSELCIKGLNNTPFPIMRALWIEELTSKIQLLITALKDYKPDNVITIQSVIDHLQKRSNKHPGLMVIIIELEVAVTTIKEVFEHQDKKTYELGSRAIH